AGENTNPPVGFEFPARGAGRLFLPTVHVHDGAVHAEADFDHALYYQSLAQPAGAARMDRTAAVAGDFMDTARGQGTIDPAKRCFKMRLFGALPNADTWIRDPA